MSNVIIPARSVVRWASHLLKRPGVVLDYGAGNLRNAVYLANRGGTVWAVDLPWQLARTTEKFSSRVGAVAHYGLVEELNESSMCFSGAVCTYVLNILSPLEQLMVLGLIQKRLIPGACLCVEVSRQTTKKCRNSFTSNALMDLVTSAGFKLEQAWAGSNWLAHRYVLEKI